MALAIFSRSPAAYKALMKLEILQLPCVRSLQRKMESALEVCGISETNMKAAADYYKHFKQQKVAEGSAEPKGEGVLILDEVRVIGKIMWNSKNMQMYGGAMTADNFTSLHDIYGKMEDRKRVAPAQSVLQFLWRDLTSSFDVIGPYFPTETSLEHRFLISCPTETMRLFETWDFHTVCIVCDGSGANLTTVKLFTTGLRGPYQRAEVEPWFTNPYNTAYRVHFVICPSHQLKNMVNALFASRQNGTKSFETIRGGRSIGFGWEAIYTMYQREVKRRDTEHARRVPGLQHSYITRDAWTKLNVRPAKIMQQEHVLAELQSYAEPDESADTPVDSKHVMATHSYLTACNLIFERGFLSHDKVTNADQHVLENIIAGYDYFETWLQELEGLFDL
ncbi:PREDICTED: uncharacterized protein LOC106813138 [Priapulus caudatus]|uniref:Uncharacterized protein LOC106813138 n=1 Tax=Priapulus caudatus TaxID=37621 RepID=A0ABM1EKG2_PRICU|nr:PREDICTED: uncharacterized protein LOC106813138 [Priapulus caudatus]